MYCYRERNGRRIGVSEKDVRNEIKCGRDEVDEVCDDGTADFIKQ